MVRQQFDTEMAFGPATCPLPLSKPRGKNPGKIVLSGRNVAQAYLPTAGDSGEFIGATLARASRDNERPVGVLLPNLNAMPVTVLSLWSADKVPAVLNYSTGSAIIWPALASPA